MVHAQKQNAPMEMRMTARAPYLPPVMTARMSATTMRIRIDLFTLWYATTQPFQFIRLTSPYKNVVFAITNGYPSEFGPCALM